MTVSQSWAIAQTTPDAPTQLSVDGVSNNLVTFSWEAPGGAPPDGIVLEGGFAPAGVAGSLALNGETTTTQIALPPGVYFVRAYAVDGGVRSAASNEVQVSVGMAARPAAPTNFAGLAVGHGIALSWHQPFTGGTPEQVALEVTGPVSGSFPLAPTGEFRVDGVPDGTYTMHLRASNATGVSDAASAVTLTLPGLVARVQEGPSRPPGDAGLPVRYERSDALRIRELAAREGLGAVVADAADEFEAVLKLKDWVAAQFPQTNPEPYPPWDALVILDAIRAGITGGFCAQYSQVMVQSLAALGMPARYLEIGPPSNPYAHFPLEFWSNQFRKWVLLDISFNVHFERDGVPLGALEVHDALLSGEAASVEVVEGAFRAGHPSPTEWPLRTIELYHYVRFHLKADHVAAPDEDPFDRWNDMIEWADPRVVPWQASTVPSEFPKVQITSRSTADRGQVEASLNDLWVTPRVTGGSEVTLDLVHAMPNIARAEYRVVDADDVAGPWRHHTSAVLVWQVTPNDRAIEVRGVNQQGVTGPSTRVALVTQ
jgi:transglutaminase-like putative cysteine protease